MAHPQMATTAMKATAASRSLETPRTTTVLVVVVVEGLYYTERIGSRRRVRGIDLNLARLHALVALPRAGNVKISAVLFVNASRLCHA